MKPTLINLLGALLLIGVMGMSHADEHKASRVALPKFPQPAGEKCVEPDEVMRRQHMDFILHQRDLTMHEGIRGKAAKYSLKGCIDCHVGYDDQGKAIPINAKGQFCESCHNYAAVSIDCFSCHRTTPLGDGKHKGSMSSVADPKDPSIATTRSPH